MRTNYRRWQKLFLFCFGLFTATAFCMKWMEGEFAWEGGKFTIIGLEINNTRREVISILSGIDDHVKTILRYHLSFDFAFMAGVYPGIAALCMMAREKSSGSLVKKTLFVLAALQFIAWGCDIAENCYLLKWIEKPDIGIEFGFYHIFVYAKWIIALSATLIAIPLVIRKRKSL